MAKSIQVCDALHEASLVEANLASPGIAQEIEHWAKPAAALGYRKAATVQAEAARCSLAAHEALVRAGKLAPEALHVIPAALARSARVTFPAPPTGRERRSW